MKDALPKRVRRNETGIVNLDNSNGPGTHWVGYKKLFDTVYYFDSFGDLPPPVELLRYFGNIKVLLFNTERVQKQNTEICGHLCLDFLANSVSFM